MLRKLRLGEKIALTAALIGIFVFISGKTKICEVFNMCDMFRKKVEIVALLPNPSGNERIYESATIRNNKNRPINLKGWLLKDNTERFWQLDSLGIIRPDEEKTIQRNFQSMGLNNKGDIIYLIDNNGKVEDMVSYKAVKQDILVTHFKRMKISREQ